MNRFAASDTPLAPARSLLAVAVRALAAALALLLVLAARPASAAVETRLLRVDPRAGLRDGAPLLTTVVELVQFSSLSEVVSNNGCAPLRGDAYLNCLSAAVEAPGAIAKPFPFPDAQARLFVRVDGAESPATFVSKTAWGAAKKDPLVGTAWLIALDASSMMGARYQDAREVANQFIGALGPNDIAKLIIFDDKLNAYRANTEWTAARDKAKLIAILAANGSPSASSGSGRPFGGQVKNIARAFGDLGNSGSLQTIPMMQAMVLLSNGAGREDGGSVAATAEVMKQFFNKGRFPEDNSASPKTPLPVISVYFPNARGFVNDKLSLNDFQYMQDISNPEIGGFFDIVQAGQSVTKARTIVKLVNDRFDKMWVVKWKLACLAPTVEQSFTLAFDNTKPPIKPDATFKEVPLGVNPTQWPLDLNLAQTKLEADANPLYPGGTFRVYGNFCWGGDKTRAEAYFVPAGSRPDPNVNRNDPRVAQQAMQTITAQNLRGGALEASDTFVSLQVPDDEKILEGSGDQMITRLVLYDNRAKRASGYDEKTVLTLKAQKKPMNLLLIAGIGGGVVVILLLLVVLLRGGGGGGGGKRGRSAAPPPAPVVAGGPPPYGAPPGGGYGAPPGYGAPGGYGGPPQGGGYGGGGYGAAPVNSPPLA
ncbi:MAG TPA: hypothetical protein PLR99_29450 [Polyangiaceae bacterium]|nr:hypothetical protein [Polyangiaceae bacterium]